MLLGGERPKLFGPLVNGLFYPPTVVTEVDNRYVVGTGGSLVAAMWTNDLRQAHRMARQLHEHAIWINANTCSSWAAPDGGIKASGLGREMGFGAAQIYTHVKNGWGQSWRHA